MVRRSTTIKQVANIPSILSMFVILGMTRVIRNGKAFFVAISLRGDDDGKGTRTAVIQYVIIHEYYYFLSKELGSVHACFCGEEYGTFLCFFPSLFVTGSCLSYGTINSV